MKKTIVLLLTLLSFFLGAGTMLLFVYLQHPNKTDASYFIKHYDSGGINEEGFIKNGINVKYNLTYYLYPGNQIMSIYVYPDYPENNKKLEREFYRISFDKDGFLRMFSYHEKGRVSNKLEFDKSRTISSIKSPSPEK